MTTSNALKVVFCTFVLWGVTALCVYSYYMSALAKAYEMARSCHEGALNQRKVASLDLDRDSSSQEKQESARRPLPVVIQQRVQRMREQCAIAPPPAITPNVTDQGMRVVDKKSVLYCTIQKAGSMFWLRYARKLCKRSHRKRNKKKPLENDPDRCDPDLAYTAFSEAARSNILQRYHKALFVRHPYTRLWSTYNQKFLIPHPSDIMEQVTNIGKAIPGADENCVKDMTFHDFIHHVTLLGAGNANRHWRTYHQLCDPCTIQYDFVGTLETFDEDWDEFLHFANLPSLRNKDHKKKTALHELVLSAKRVGFTMERYGKLKKKCLGDDKWLVDKRLGVLRNSGFLNEHSMNQSDLDRWTVGWPSYREGSARAWVAYSDRFVNRLLQNMKVGRNETEVNSLIKRAKVNVMKEQFRTLAPELRMKLDAIYEIDLKLFGYDMPGT